ncbi:MAG: VanZ family protein [Ignavibacteriales bacterium]|nr:VanZ family protein [Ignavibacteriales bacterium]
MELILNIAERYAGYLFSGFLCLILLLTLLPFTFFQENEAVLLPGGGVYLTPPSIIYTDSLPATCRNLTQFTILVHYTPGISVRSYSTTLLSNAANSGEVNFSLFQYGSTLAFRLGGAPGADRCTLVIENAVRRNIKIWCGIEYDGEFLRAYVDGVKRAERRTGHINLSGWNTSHPLVLGSDPNGYSGWTGVVYTLAFFDESLPGFSFRDPELLMRIHSPALLFTFQSAEHDRILSVGRDSTTALFIPRPYAPARRTVLVESPRAFFKERISVQDIVANILLFLPLGFCFGAIVDRKRRSVLRLALEAAALGFFISLFIELVQAYLPGRYSSIMDVLSNTAGALLGVMLFHLRHWFFAVFREQPPPAAFPDE